MEQHTGSQYDDDLTVGMDEYGDSLHTGDVDLFEFVGDEESPITRLKTIILSIDWEITDEILRQFNIELLDLKDIWANDKINLVYVQALEKISKYIYQEKADANPNAIKLLLNFYSNLEKIVSTESMPEEEKKRLLMEDVEKFEKLKKQISRSTGKPQVQTKKSVTEDTFRAAPALRIDEPLPTDGEKEDPLLNLKAIVFGMDWEITDADLNNLGEEVRRLEKRFSNSKAKLIFLQGIGALGAYINLKRSNAHVDAFKLLHSFFLSLENCVRNGLTGEEEKRLLMPEVEKFNAFKSAIAFTLTPETGVAEEEKEDEHHEDSLSTGGEITPAFADLPEEVHGFQEEEEAASLGTEEQLKVDGQIERFFDNGKTPSVTKADEEIQGDDGKSELIGEMESRLQRFFGEEPTLQQMGETSGDVALQGVVVETEADDDSGEEALPRFGDELAPALSDNFEESSFSEKAIAGELGEEGQLPETEDQIAGIFDAGTETQTAEDISAALQGVEVETEADDDSEEEPLPRTDEELAPALFSLEDEAEPVSEPVAVEESLGIEGQLEQFFSDDSAPGLVVDDQAALQGIDVGVEEEAEFSQDDVTAKDEFSPADYSFEEEIETSVPTLSQEIEPSLVTDEVAFLSDDSIQEEVESEIGGDIFNDGTESGVVSEIQEQPALVAEEVSPAIISESEVGLFFDAEEKASEEVLAVDFEDHLKEFFEVAGDEAVSEKEAPEIDFSEAASEPKEGGELGSAEALFLTEEVPAPEPVEVKDDILTLDEEPSIQEGIVDSDFSPVFNMDEDVSFDTAEKQDVFALEEEEVSQEQQEEELVDFATEKEESEAVFEFTEEVHSSEDVAAETVFAAVQEKPVESISVLKEGEDFVEYIEEVEFDTEDEELGTAIEPEETGEEVVFEAADEESVAVGEPGEAITFDEMEEELGKYFGDLDSAKQDEIRKQPEETEELFKDTEVFGQRLTEGLMEPGIHADRMNLDAVSPAFVAGGVMAAVSAAKGMPGEPATQGTGFAVPESGMGRVEGGDPLSRLRGCIASLGLEINDSILRSLFEEINTLQNLWITKPAEKTFLQLLSTLAQHIDSYRHEASPEAHGLLMSVFDKLELCRLTGVESIEIQEGLLSETTKILLWQQKMLSRKAVEQGEDFGAIFEAVDDDTEIDEPRISQTSGLGIQYDRTSLKETRKPDMDVDTEKITQIVKDELAILRQSIKTEMADLLEQYFDKGRKENL